MESFKRIEHDLVGEMEVPADTYCGIHTLRAVENFPITGQRLLPETIVTMAEIKKACAITNLSVGELTEEIANAIIQSCDEIIEDKNNLRSYFVVDPIQGGAGTSTNMNANEVIANRAIEILGGKKGDYTVVHPNDHVNRGQSTNDAYPTCGRLTIYKLTGKLIDELTNLINVMHEKSAAFDDVVKMGRTQLQDAVPIRLGQEFAAYECVLTREKERLLKVQQELAEVNLGGTAVGTGVNANPEYMKNVVPCLAKITGIPVKQSENLIDATQNLDAYVAFSSALKSCAVSLSKICNDLRLMSSGPRDGLMEIVLPARQNGSSIMPGKINPVILEVVNQIAFRIIGYDVTISMAVEAGQLELNAFEPVIFDSLNSGIMELTQGLKTLRIHCVEGIIANRNMCTEEVRRSIGLVTALCPYIGYSRACELAREAMKTGENVETLVRKYNLLPEEKIHVVLDPLQMT